MTTQLNFRVRFRFRLTKKLYIQDTEYRFKIGSREVILSPQLPDLNISDSEWLVLNARGFSSKEDAINFAQKLKLVCEVSSASSRLGVDSGLDKATSGFGELVREHFEKNGVLLRNNVHGVDVFEDNPNIRILNMSGSATVSASSEPFIADIGYFFNTINNLSKETKDTILLLNYALMCADPIGQIIFSISAVEMLGQNEVWTINQKALIAQLAASCHEYDIGSEVEKTEVAEAINKGLFKLSLRQGVIRLLEKLDLLHLKKRWDKIYSQRSTLVHGLIPEPGVDYGPFAYEVISLCGYILLTSISKEVPDIKKNIDKLYSQSSNFD